MTPKEAFNDIMHELRQRHMDMYADCDKESVSLVIDEMNKRENIVDKALTELEKLKKNAMNDDVIKVGDKVIYQGKEYFYCGYEKGYYNIGNKFLNPLRGVPYKNVDEIIKIIPQLNGEQS